MQLKLKTNGRENPLGVNKSIVKLNVETENIKVDSICFQLFQNKRDMEIGKASCTLTSNRYFCYVGPLNSCEKYYWRATVYSGAKVYSASTSFETGLSNEDFTAKWVENPDYDGHVAEIKKTFHINGSVKKARLYIVGLGFYKSFINGKETDDNYFKPVLTDFDLRTGLNNKGYNEDNFNNDKKSVCYDTFDVTDKIKAGENSINVLLGTGWYCNEDKNITDPSFNYGNPKLIFELHVETKNGKQIIISDKDCQARNVNIKSQLFACDKIDFTAPENSYKKVKLAKAPTGKLYANEGVLDKVIEVIKPLNTAQNGGVTEYDFGKNHTGGLKMTVKGKRGRKLTVKFYEVKTNGELDILTGRWLAYEDGKYLIGHLDQQCEYILSGGDDFIEPYFHWSSYRYATLECDGDYEVKDVKSLFISSDVLQDGFFNCSNEFLNRLNEVFLTTQRANMHCSVPSDCPQREKLPYTGDGQLVAETVLYSLDVFNFYKKWFNDIVAAQGNNGYVPYTAPFIAGGGGLWWSNALVVIPDLLYRFSGDERIIMLAVDACLKLVDYYNTKHNGDYIIYGSDSSWCLGDWLTPEVTVLDKMYMNTLAWYFAICKTEEMCVIAGLNGKLPYLKDLKEKVKNAINEKYFNAKTCDYADGIQGANILPAINGVADALVAEKLLKKLVAQYDKDPHFDTGIVLTPKLLDALTLAGRSDVAFRVLTEKTAPSYYDMIDGETTLPEHWFKHWPGQPGTDVSHSHPMFGSVLLWVYKHVAGLDISELYAKKITYAPKVIKEVNGASMSKNTPYGRASVEYSVKEEFILKAEVPFGITGEIILPDYIETFTVDGNPATIMEKKDSKNTFVVYGGEHIVIGRIKR